WLRRTGACGPTGAGASGPDNGVENDRLLLEIRDRRVLLPVDCRSNDDRRLDLSPRPALCIALLVGAQSSTQRRGARRRPPCPPRSGPRTSALAKLVRASKLPPGDSEERGHFHHRLPVAIA